MGQFATTSSMRFLTHLKHYLLFKYLSSMLGVQWFDIWPSQWRLPRRASAAETMFVYTPVTVIWVQWLPKCWLCRLYSDTVLGYSGCQNAGCVDFSDTVLGYSGCQNAGCVDCSDTVLGYSGCQNAGYRLVTLW